MARVCTICGKGYLSTFKRSHSMRPTKVRLYPNLQWMKIEHGRIKVCTKCLKTETRKLAKVAVPANASASADK
ncbi:MAG: 50S ribosomal protein L28 [Candidatus Doudnabacteria bacterium RIFCSPLOWO2_02_FULL_48_8]|nr:MAG: 50S ribosomal protein L28 [Candidatus Doudnabacteria bacterium RIFCSPLOWO2_02_FULL_48_8]